MNPIYQSSSNDTTTSLYNITLHDDKQFVIYIQIQNRSKSFDVFEALKFLYMQLVGHFKLACLATFV